MADAPALQSNPLYPRLARLSSQSQQPLLQIPRQRHAETQRPMRNRMLDGKFRGMQGLPRCAAGIFLRRLANGMCVELLAAEAVANLG